MPGNQGSGTPNNVASLLRPFEYNRGAADDVLPEQSIGASGDILGQSAQAAGKQREQQQ